MRGNGRRKERNGGKGLGFWSSAAHESIQVLGINIHLWY
jgi:hypothetical protein